MVLYQEWKASTKCQYVSEGWWLQKEERKTLGESFSWSAGIFRLDNQSTEHKPPWLTHTAERLQTHICTDTNTLIHTQIMLKSIPSQTATFRLNGLSHFSLPVFVRPAARCSRTGEKEEMTSMSDNTWWGRCQQWSEGEVRLKFRSSLVHSGS